MTRCRLGKILALALFASSSLVGHGLAASKAEFGAFAAANGGGWRATWSADGSQIIALRGGKTAASRARPADIAARFIEAQAGLLGLARSSLKMTGERESLSGKHYTFSQTTNGRPVFNGVVDVHVNGSGQIFLVTSNGVTDADVAALSNVMPMIPAAAIARARAANTPMPSGKPGQPAYEIAAAVNGAPVLGYLRTNAGGKLVYEVSFGPLSHYVNAETGAVELTRNRLHLATGHGTVFSPNPVYTLDKGTLTDRNNASYPALNPAYRERDLLGITHKLGRYYLRDRFVKAVDLTPSEIYSCAPQDWGVVGLPPKSRTTNNFLYNRSQVNFEHVMAYYHIDKSQRYLQQLGFTNMVNYQIRVDAHAIDIDNSYYCGNGTTGYIAFGDGGVDDAEDTDVILHEYGHAIQDSASAGKYDFEGEAGAQGEGFGDYWMLAAATANAKWALCFGDWDSEGACWRRLDENKVYPGDIVGEVHADGEIWSQALNSLRLALGRTKFNKLVLDSHTLVPVNPLFSDGLQAILDADQGLYAGADSAAICAAFAPRGIKATGCP